MAQRNSIQLGEKVDITTLKASYLHNCTSVPITVVNITSFSSTAIITTARVLK
ncbi:hypothetical protein FH972_014388 [Carpinus fangiana]|uniref:Uncharacterized protein n=1 Tax=Carpinus fangiana TaxID=176857 RepID=A0A5N6RAM5_9ROSI|nr:hypothetical protein FH972_014388 [Carpinus fangiana]